MKFYQRRSVALIVLILAILGASVYGISKRPEPLPEVEYYHWITDEDDLLGTDTEELIEKYNAAWDDQYRAVIAVAAVETVNGWKIDDFAYTLGEAWGLGSNDMLLLLVKGDDYYVALGDTLTYAMTDTQQAKLQSAIEPDYYDGDYDAAAVAFFRQADVFYAQALKGQSGGSTQSYVWEDGSANNNGSIFGAIVLIVLIFVVWALLDRVRYSRYRRRVVVTPGISYYPVFWGRPRRPVPPPPPRRPAPPPPRPPAGGGYRPPRSTPPRSNPPRSTTSNRSSGFGGSNRGGFGGSSRSSRSSGGSRGSFGGGSRGGSRGGFGGGRR